MTQSFTPTGSTVNLMAGTSTASVALPALSAPSGADIRVYNGGNVTAFVNFGDANVVASASTSLPIAPGTVEVFSVNPNQTYAAAITAAGNGTVYFTPGQGN